MFSLKQIIEQPQLIENISNEQLNDWLKAYPYVSFLHLEKYKRNRTDEQKNKTAFYITHRDVIFKIDYSTQTQGSDSIQDTPSGIITPAIQLNLSETNEDSIVISKEQNLTTEQIAEIEPEKNIKESEVEIPNQEPEKLSIADQILAELKHRKEEDHTAQQQSDELEIVETEQAETITETFKIESEKNIKESEIEIPNQEPEKLSIADQILAELKHRKEEAHAAQQHSDELEIIETEQVETIVETPEIESENIIEESEVENTTQELEKLSIADQILAELKHRKEEEHSTQYQTDKLEIVETTQAETIVETLEIESEKTTEEIEAVEQENKPISLVDQILAEFKNRKETANIQTLENENQTVEEIKSDVEELEVLEQTSIVQNVDVVTVQTSEIKTSLEEESQVVEQPKTSPKPFSIADQILSAIQQITSKVITIPMEKAIAQIKETESAPQPETIATKQTEINVDVESNSSLPIIKIANDFIFDKVQFEIIHSNQENFDNLELPKEEDDTYFPSIPFDESKAISDTNNDIKIEKIKSLNENNLQAIKIDSFIPKSDKTIQEKQRPDIVLKEISDFRQSSEHTKINIDEINPIEQNRHKIIEISQKDETHTFLEWLNIVDKSYEQNTQRLDTTRMHYNYENQFILENKSELQQSILEGELDSETEIDEDVNKMAEESISFKQEMATEILAKILVKQEHFEKAIEVYQKLILKYPEKSSTFVAQIEFLKNQIQ